MDYALRRYYEGPDNFQEASEYFLDDLVKQLDTGDIVNKLPFSTSSKECMYLVHTVYGQWYKCLIQLVTYHDTDIEDYDCYAYPIKTYSKGRFA